MILSLEQQVCSLESAKRLKELGVRQESLFYWRLNPRPKEDYTDTEKEAYLDNKYWPSDMKEGLVVSAYTVAEIIYLLGDKFGVLERFPHSGEFGAYIPNDIGVSATGEKIADVLAELLEKTYEES